MVVHEVCEVAREQSSDLVIGGCSEDEAYMGPVMTRFPFHADGIKGVFIPSRLRTVEALNKITRHYGVDTEEV